jgi:hypothetical protein
MAKTTDGDGGGDDGGKGNNNNGCNGDINGWGQILQSTKTEAIETAVAVAAVVAVETAEATA